ncbi:MFS transporter [Pseudochelatococcus contaminans]|uniref:Putative MFS transporter n=1 Tax=Pseudochelatococcus contaminans TaxID=1538103 RepID=A0A7W5Z5F8_9HYPH|nr:MFS transporter [Pseudochelatococcus contaminans]MBB3810535.1 putative MFS transporter [Pseudochelatococcus contaminans]
MKNQSLALGSLEDAPLNKFHKRLTIYSSGGPFLDGYVLSIIGVVMAQITSALELSTSWEGLVAASALIGIFFGGFFGGWFTDRFGRKVLYLVDLIAIVGFSVAQFWVESALMLFVWRFLLGVAVGADYPIATAFLAEFLPRKHRGPLLGFMLVMWFAGAACAYIAGSLILHFGGEDAWRYALASALVPGILFLFARAGTPESPRWLLSKGRKDEANRIIKQVYGPEYSIANMAEPEKDSKLSIWSLFHSGYGKRMLFVTIFWTCAVVPLFAIYSFAPTVLAALGVAESDATFGSVVITIIFVLGCLLAMKLVNLMGRRQMLIHSFIWSGVPLAVLGFFPDAAPIIVVMLFCAYALANGGAQVMEFVYPNELFPTEIRATAVGLATSLSRIGTALGVYLVPISVSSIGIGNTMLVAAGVCFIGAWNTYVMAPETRELDLHAAASLDH